MSLGKALKALLDCYDLHPCDSAIRGICRTILKANIRFEVITDGPYLECNDGESAYWATSYKTLMIESEKVAEWLRCIIVAYGDIKKRSHVNTWYITEDYDADSGAHYGVQLVLSLLKFEDVIPEVPEPLACSQSSKNGKYAVLYSDELSKETAKCAWIVISRFESCEDAQLACNSCCREYASRTVPYVFGPIWSIGILAACDNGETRWNSISGLTSHPQEYKKILENVDYIGEVLYDYLWEPTMSWVCSFADELRWMNLHCEMYNLILLSWDIHPAIPDIRIIKYKYKVKKF